MNEETDEGLLTLVQFRESDPKVADEAAAEFVSRYQKVLERHCNALVARFPDVGYGGDDLALMTLLKAIERAETYKPCEDSENSAPHTFSWLKKIAENMIKDLVRNPRRGTITLVDALESTGIGDDDIAEFLVAHESSLVTNEFSSYGIEAFKKLSEREQFVLAMTVELRLASPSGEYVARNEGTALADYLGITPDGVRQIRRRAIKKINEYIKEQVA